MAAWETRSSGESGVGASELRSVLRQFATGTTVVTVATDPPHGMTANAFTSVSLDPPLVLVCVRQASTTHRAIGELGTFAVSVLAADQADVARHFADPRRGSGRGSGRGEFDDVAWCPGVRTGAPVLVHAVAWLECRVVERMNAGDHSVFLASVVDSGTGIGVGRDPLVFHRSGYHRLGSVVEAGDKGGSVELVRLHHRVGHPFGAEGTRIPR